MDEFQEIMNTLNKPLILSKPISNLHKIFMKYTNNPYYKYAFDLLETLCTHTNYDNKKRLLHMAFTYLTLILYNCGNIPYLSNFDLMILCCFNLGVKTVENQKNVLCLNKLRKIYKEKYNNYKKEEIIKVELICIKLLNYKIDILTPYECLYYLIHNQQKNKKKDFLELATKELENELINNIKENINKKPLDIAQKIIDGLNQKKISVKYPKIIKKKIIPMSHPINVNKKKLDNNNNNNQKNNDDNSFIDTQITSNMSSITINKNTQLNSHRNNNYSDLKSNNNKLKSNIYSKPISLVFTYPENNYSSYKKNKINSNLNRHLILSSSNLFNSFSKLDVEQNNSPVNKTNCESSSPNGSDGISSFIVYNNSGMNLTTQSSSGNAFNKPCLNSKISETSFRNEKSKNSSNNINSELNLNDDYIFGNNLNIKIPAKNKRSNAFSRTFYSEKQRWVSKNKIKNIKAH